MNKESSYENSSDKAIIEYSKNEEEDKKVELSNFVQELEANEAKKTSEATICFNKKEDTILNQEKCTLENTQRNSSCCTKCIVL